MMSLLAAVTSQAVTDPGWIAPGHSKPNRPFLDRRLTNGFAAALAAGRVLQCIPEKAQDSR